MDPPLSPTNSQTQLPSSNGSTPITSPKKHSVKRKDKKEKKHKKEESQTETTAATNNINDDNTDEPDEPPIEVRPSSRSKKRRSIRLKHSSSTSQILKTTSQTTELCVESKEEGGLSTPRHRNRTIVTKLELTNLPAENSSGNSPLMSRPKSVFGITPPPKRLSSLTISSPQYQKNYAKSETNLLTHSDSAKVKGALSDRPPPKITTDSLSVEVPKKSEAEEKKKEIIKKLKQIFAHQSNYSLLMEHLNQTGKAEAALLAEFYFELFSLYLKTKEFDKKDINEEREKFQKHREDIKKFYQIEKYLENAAFPKYLASMVVEFAHPFISIIQQEFSETLSCLSDSDKVKKVADFIEDSPDQPNLLALTEDFLLRYELKARVMKYLDTIDPQLLTSSFHFL